MIEIGEYVRTNNGYIDVFDKESKDNEFKKIFLTCKKRTYWLVDIVNHSKNIKELIKEHDVLRYKLYKTSFPQIGEVKKYRNPITDDKYLGVEGFNLEQIEILEILTKEKIKENSYKVEEKGMLKREYYQYELIDLVGKDRALEIINECKKTANSDVILFERELKKQVDTLSEKGNKDV